jgi:hypothetical protein
MEGKSTTDSEGEEEQRKRTRLSGPDRFWTVLQSGRLKCDQCKQSFTKSRWREHRKAYLETGECPVAHLGDRRLRQHAPGTSCMHA